MSESTKIRVLIVDDHPVVLEGIRAALNAEPDLMVVGEASEGSAAVELFRTSRPNVTLMDLQMPGMNGLEAIAAIRQIDDRARILVLTTYSGDVQAAKALKAGASGYLLKSSMRTDLIKTVREVAAGKRRVPADVACSLAENLDADWLSERELQVLRAAAAGNSNKLIASALGISENTVKGHMKNVLLKLRANDRTHAVTIALRRGFLDQ